MVEEILTWSFTFLPDHPSLYLSSSSSGLLHSLCLENNTGWAFQTLRIKARFNFGKELPWTSNKLNQFCLFFNYIPQRLSVRVSIFCLFHEDSVISKPEKSCFQNDFSLPPGVSWFYPSLCQMLVSMIKLSSLLDTNHSTFPAKIPDNSISSATAGGFPAALKIIPRLSALLPFPDGWAWISPD